MGEQSFVRVKFDPYPSESSLETVNEYKAFRKKLDSRRLALDAAISKAQNTKKDSRSLELEVENCRERL